MEGKRKNQSVIPLNYNSGVHKESQMLVAKKNVGVHK